MLNKFYITLVSDQAVPNVQYFKEFQPFKEVLFITSTSKASKIEAIENTLKELSNNTVFRKIDDINEESYLDIQNKIKAFISVNNINFNDYELIVNITLGTKIMSLALADFFKSFQNTKILYSPIGKNKYKSVYDETINNDFETKITFKEYFSSYGVKINASKVPHKVDEYVSKFFDHFLEFKENDYSILGQMREGSYTDKENKIRQFKGRDNGIRDIALIEGLSDFLCKLDYEYKDNKLSNKMLFF